MTVTIDLTPAGHQPMVHPQSGDQIIFNGEIYNFKTLKADLEGYRQQAAQVAIALNPAVAFDLMAFTITVKCLNHGVRDGAQISFTTQYPTPAVREVPVLLAPPTINKYYVVDLAPGRSLVEHLEPGGYLFVGHAESLTRVSHQLEYVKPAVYRKPAINCKPEGRWNRSS